LLYELFKESLMAVDTSPRSSTWTYVEGEWLTGNPPLIGPTSHAMWLASTRLRRRPLVRWHRAGSRPALPAHQPLGRQHGPEAGVTRLRRSRRSPGKAIRKFDGKTPIYIKPMYWGEHGSPGSVVSVDGDSTRFALCLFEAPLGNNAAELADPLALPPPDA
jgi:branched-chain amino acid aminotransferase